MRSSRFNSAFFIIGLCAVPIVLISVWVRSTFSLWDQEPGEAVWISKGELFKEIFRDPWEAALFVFRDGHYFTITSREESNISVSPGQVIQQIRLEGKTSADLLFVIHSHPHPVGFTFADECMYRRLVSEGFTGLFGIYHPFNGKTRWTK